MKPKKRTTDTNSEEYSKRELDSYFNGIKTAIVDSERRTSDKLTSQDAVLHEIKTQTIKTNGRVSALELWREGVIGKFVGAFTILGIIWGLILRYFL